jgi:hypothetical protein
MAGWAPSDSQTLRQVASDNWFNHYPGDPGGVGQYWARGENSIHIDPGDSGGPLFVRRFRQTSSDGSGYWYRDVLGVTSGTDNVGDYWTDITRGQIASWLSTNIADPIPRTTNWQNAHPGYGGWLGDVEYTGACWTQADRDCDHWYDWHDNCPSIPNWDQRDSFDTGHGDVCPPQAPSTTPSCVLTGACDASVSADCQPTAYVIVLQAKDINGNWDTIGQGSPGAYGGDVWFKSAQNWLYPGSTGTFHTCNESQGLITCGADVTLSGPDPSTCSSGVGPGGGYTPPPCVGTSCMPKPVLQ